MSWFSYNSGRKTHSVATKKANDWGLHDMHGNVFEWCSDWYSDYPGGVVTDPKGPSLASGRVLRGGGWGSKARLCRSAFRFQFTSVSRANDLGFRVVLRSQIKSSSSVSVIVPGNQPSPPSQSKPKLRDSTTNSIGMKLMYIPDGEFMMGSPAGEKDREDDETQHRVRLTKSFYMGSTEVTQGQWQKVMGTKPWRGKDYVKEGAAYPATYVSWDDAVAFCKKLSQKEGKTYTLPTEAEWEYACRAGNPTAYTFGDDPSSLGRYAWYDENALDVENMYSLPVGGKTANAWGLYDIHGNVWEWCSDWYGDYPSGTVKDPKGHASASLRVRRGGSWGSNAWRCRSADRARLSPDSRYYNVGFRVVLRSK